MFSVCTDDEVSAASATAECKEKGKRLDVANDLGAKAAPEDSCSANKAEEISLIIM